MWNFVQKRVMWNYSILHPKNLKRKKKISVSVLDIINHGEQVVFADLDFKSIYFHFNSPALSRCRQQITIGP